MSKLSVLVLAAVLLVASAAAFPKWRQLHQYTFHQYVRDARRPYAPGTAQYATREKIFNAKLADIKQHNADPSKTWKRGVNQFTDWTKEEWSNYNRAKVSYEPTHIHGEEKAIKANPNELPKFVDYRNRVNPPILSGVKNQGSCGSCWAHSATESMESYFALKYGQFPVLSTQQVTACTASVSGCGGGSYVAGWEYVAMQGGLNEEWTYGYTDFFAAQMSEQDTSACRNITKLFPTINAGTSQAFTFTWWPKANITGYTRVKRNDALAMMTALALVGPQAITVASDSWADYESGVLMNNYAANYTWQDLNHDVQMVGYGWDFDLNLNYWIVRNSWGTNYGEEGFIRLYRPEHEPCGDMTGQKICGTSGCLINPGYPQVETLDDQNGYYF